MYLLPTVASSFSSNFLDLQRCEVGKDKVEKRQVQPPVGYL